MKILALLIILAFAGQEQINITLNIPTEVAEEVTAQEPSSATADAYGYSGADIDLLARTVQAEAGGEDERGKRLIVACIINRMSSDMRDFAGQTTVGQVIYAPSQFVTADWASAECYDAVYKELAEPSDQDVLWFASTGYQPFGTPLYQHGGHYFNGK